MSSITLYRWAVCPQGDGTPIYYCYAEDEARALCDFMAWQERMGQPVTGDAVAYRTA